MGCRIWQPIIFQLKEAKKMSRKAALDFLERHGMSPERIDPGLCAPKMRDNMERGLGGDPTALPMIPTYLKMDGAVPKERGAVVIDAGGTNFRSGLARFTEWGFETEGLSKCSMPGIEKPATWEEFISFVADRVMPLTDRADCIGFCFSYSADITPEIDGRVIRIDKEVVVNGSAGKLVGASLLEELERRGVSGKKIVILNDTAAVLLGGSSALDMSAYGGFIGQVSGTGTNTCCLLPASRITKLGRTDGTKMIVNLESGLYDELPRGDFDLILDEESNNPGLKLFEKMTAGVYLGELCRLMLRAAADEGLLDQKTAENARALGRIDSAVIDAWASGEKLEEFCGSREDGEFVKTLCLSVFERSARCMCTNLTAIMLLTGEGDDPEKPVCVCAEGSLVQKGRHYRPALERLLKEYSAEKLGKHAVLKVGQETTLPGSAAAALLNCRE